MISPIWMLPSMTRTPWDHGKTTTERGLGWAWQKQRKRVLQRDMHLCQDCLSHGLVTAATECHHLVPRAKAGPALAKDEDVISLCHECHEKRDAQEQGRKLRRAVGLDGYPLPYGGGVRQNH